MCQQVSGPLENLKERFAYKVVTSKNKGIFYPTCWNRATGWSISCSPGSHVAYYVLRKTNAGYHVFKTKDGAMAYRGNNEKVIKIKIKGKALPFKYRRYEGYAVQYWKELT